MYALIEIAMLLLSFVLLSVLIITVVAFRTFVIPQTKVIKSYASLSTQATLFAANFDDERSEDNTVYKFDASAAEQSPEGYLNPDFNTVGDGKQLRVLIYIALALLPCLFLIPFFLSRDFVPASGF